MPALLLLSCTVDASGSPDSLWKALYNTDDISRKISIYLSISKTYEDSRPDSAVHYWKEAQNLAIRQKSDRPIADVYAQAAFFALKQNQLDQAYLNFTLAAKYYRNADEIRLYVRMKSMLGSLCQVRDNLSEAMTYYMEVISLSEERKLFTILPHVLNNVGNIYMDAAEFSQALGYYTRAAEIFRQIRDSVNIVYPLVNMAECYYYLDNNTLSGDYIRQGLEVAVVSGDRLIESRCLMLMGMIHEKEHDYAGAADLMLQGIDKLRLGEGKHPGPPNVQLSEAYTRLAENYYEAGDLDQALLYARKGFSLSRFMKLVRWMMVNSRHISLVHEARGQYDSALFYQRISADQLDTLSKSGTVRAVKLMEVQREFEKKQKEAQISVALEKSSKRTLLIIYIASGVVLLAVIIILFLMLKLERQRKAKTELEKTSLSGQLEHQNKELTTNVMYLTRMNEMVMMIAEKLRALDLDEKSNNAHIVQSIVGELERSSNPDNWKEFEVRFQQVHIDFYRKLGENFPDLTPNELKLCAFLRLNMTTKEIMSITYQSQNSIMVARSRLRQKLGITKDENLVTFLSQF